MSGSLDIIVIVWDLVKWKLLQSLLIIITFAAIPAKSFFTLTITVLVYSYLFDLFSSKPKIGRWTKRLVLTFGFFLALAAIYRFFGIWGIAGTITASIVITLAWLAYILYSNWKVYDSVTTWGAQRITGKTKADYKLDEVLDEQKRINQKN